MKLVEDINYIDDVDTDNIHSEDELDDFLWDMAKELYPHLSDDDINDKCEELYDELYDNRLISDYNIDYDTGDTLSYYYDENSVKSYLKKTVL